MPRRNQTGPAGHGAGTGRGLGGCLGITRSSFFGLGNRLGRGFGFRNILVQAPPVYNTAENEKTLLEKEILAIEDELKYLKEKLQSLNS